MGEMQLKWNDHDKDLSTKLWEYFQEEYLVDFNVTCHGQQKKVHKFVLAFLFPMLKESFRSSDTFSLGQDLVNDGSSNGSSAIPEALCLNLDNIAEHPEDMDYLIQFAYTGKATVPNEHADCLMHIADTMEIGSLKDSLGQWHKKSENNTEPNAVTPLSRLRRRTVLKKVIDENGEKFTFDDDMNFHSVIDSEASLSSIEESNDEDKNKKSKKKKNDQNKSPHKFKSEDHRDKEKNIRTDKKQNSAKTSEKQTKPETVSPKKPCGRPPKEHKTLNCPHCDYVAIYPIRLQRHLESHAKKRAKAEGPKLYPCKICKKRFESRLLLEIHRDSNCGTEPPVCKYCDFKTHRKQILQHHIISMHHMDEHGNLLEKNMKCPDCDFVCYAKHQLRVHARAKHERMGKYKCKEKECNFTAPYLTNLMRHERIKHQKVRNYMCEECGFRFQNISHMKRHVLVKHKGLKPHKCDICNTEYVSSFHFKEHMDRHEGKVEYKFVCHICGHNLRRKYELRAHMRKKHGMELEEALATTSVTNPCQLQDVCESTS